MLGLLLSLLSCDNTTADTSELSEPAIEPIVETPPPEGWVLDEPLQCSNPAEPSWFDIGPTTATSLPEDSFMIDVEPGAIALLEEDGEYLLFHSPPFEPAQAIDPLTGAVVIPDLGYSVGGYNVGDLNNDGELDLIVGGNYSVIVYSVMSDDRVVEDPPWLVECIMEPTGCFFRRTPREMVIGDFNLDGLNDVFVGFTNATGRPVPDLRHEMFWGAAMVA